MPLSLSSKVDQIGGEKTQFRIHPSFNLSLETSSTHLFIIPCSSIHLFRWTTKPDKRMKPKYLSTSGFKNLTTQIRLEPCGKHTYEKDQ